MGRRETMGEKKFECEDAGHFVQWRSKKGSDEVVVQLMERCSLEYVQTIWERKVEVVTVGRTNVVRGEDAFVRNQRCSKECFSRGVLSPFSSAPILKTKGGQDVHLQDVRLLKQQQKQHFSSTKLTDLPVQVCEKLLQLLPIQSLFQAQAVCKSWNSIISSSSFLPLWLENFHDRAFLMGYPDGRQVVAFSDVALQRKWKCFTPPPPPFLTLSEDVLAIQLAIHPAASDGGLILYFCQDSCKGTTNLCVFNPFTGSYRMLPPVDLVTQGVGRTEVLISTDESGSTYLVFVVGLTWRPNKNKAGIVLSIYDSRTRTWVRRGITPEDDSIAPGNWSAVHHNGILYILSHVDGVISYDYAQDVWGRVGTPLREIYVNGWLVHEKLLIHEGRLLLTGTTCERDEYTDELLHRLYIYELRTQPGYGDSPYVSWELFDRMPDAVMEDIDPYSRANILPPEYTDELLEDIDPQSFAAHNVLPVSCFQCEDVLLLVFHGQSVYNYLQGPALIAYNLSSKTWTRIHQWNEFAALQTPGIEKKRAVSGFAQEGLGGPHLMFNVVGFKPSLTAT
ncbi:unnamed protein product [Calypogeia fissa]